MRTREEILEDVPKPQHGQSYDLQMRMRSQMTEIEVQLDIRDQMIQIEKRLSELAGVVERK